MRVALSLPSTHDRDSCSRKARYRTKSQARNVARRCQSERGQRLYIYECKVCDGYHLTKTPQEKHRAIVRGDAP